MAKSNDSLEVCHSRIKFILFGLCIAFTLIEIRLFELTTMSPDDLKPDYYVSQEHEFTLKRANIIDRNGNLLATNITTASLYATPKDINNPEEAAKILSSVMPNLGYKNLLRKLKSNKHFIWLARHVPPKEQQIVHNLGIPGIYFAEDEKRVYPQTDLFAQTLGFVDIDSNGIAGIEKYFNQQLTTQNSNQDALQLSLDSRVQNILKEELQDAINTHEAIGGSGIIMDVNNGEILAISSLPDFNPHNIESLTHEQLFNSATLGTYEMGSTMKLLTVAMGLDSGMIKTDQAFNVSQPLKIANFTINDYKGKGGELSVPEILMYSSNLGIAQIASKVGNKTQKDYLHKLGLLTKTRLEIPELSSPLYPQDSMWGELSMVTISYGHGIAITPMHIAQAVATVVNGGTAYQPTLLKHKSVDTIKGERIFSESTSKIMRKLMHLIVDKGYGKKANVPGYFVGGKTGTAEKNVNGKYNKKANLASFVGAFPMHNPKYLVMIMVDEAKPNQQNFGFTTGGMIAAPVAGNVIKRIAPLLNIHPESVDDRQIQKILQVNYTPRHKESQ